MAESIPAWGEGTRNLTPAQAKIVSESKLARVEMEDPPERWLLHTNSRVGWVHGDGWDVEVVPKIPIRKLMFLLGYALDPNGWRDTITGFGEDDLFEAIASGFSTLAIRAIEPVPIRGYSRVNERSPTLRGRIRIADQMARVLPTPLEISRDEYTIDVPENRAILAATELLLRFRRVPLTARSRLLRIRSQLDGVQARLATSEEIPPSRLNVRYQQALKLAALILRGSSVSTEGGSNASASFIFDLNRVFEDFLSEALTASIRRLGGDTRLQYGDRYLDLEQSIRLFPDIVWVEGGVPRAVIDAKFKEISDRRFPNADAYQMLAYCSALEVDAGFLIYARDKADRARKHSLVGSSAVLRVRTVDVDTDPEELLGQIDDLAAEIRDASLPLGMVVASGSAGASSHD